MLKNKKLEIRVVSDSPTTPPDGVASGSDSVVPEEKIQNLIAAKLFLQDTAWVIGSIMILKFGLRIAEHIIVTKLKY